MSTFNVSGSSILMPLEIKEIDLAEEKKKKKERSPIDEALEILERYEEGTPPRKFGYED